MSTEIFKKAREVVKGLHDFEEKIGNEAIPVLAKCLGRALNLPPTLDKPMADAALKGNQMRRDGVVALLDKMHEKFRAKDVDKSDNPSLEVSPTIQEAANRVEKVIKKELPNLDQGKKEHCKKEALNSFAGLLDNALNKVVLPAALEKLGGAFEVAKKASGKPTATGGGKGSSSEPPAKP